MIGLICVAMRGAQERELRERADDPQGKAINETLTGGGGGGDGDGGGCQGNVK